MFSAKGFFGGFLFVFFVFFFLVIFDTASKANIKIDSVQFSLLASSSAFTKKAVSENFASNAILSILKNSSLFSFESSVLKERIDFALVSFLKSYGASKIGSCNYSFYFSSNKLRKGISFASDSFSDFSNYSKVLVLKKQGFVFVEFFVPEASNFFPCALFSVGNSKAFFALLPGFSKSALVVLR